MICKQSFFYSFNSLQSLGFTTFTTSKYTDAGVSILTAPVRALGAVKLTVRARWWRSAAAHALELRAAAPARCAATPRCPAACTSAPRA